MYKVEKKNRVLRIPDEKFDEYKKMGYIIRDENDNVLFEPENIKATAEKLKKENDKLKAKLEEVTLYAENADKKIAELQKENDKLKAAVQAQSATGDADPAEAEKKANEILEREKNGEDFDALIKEYNEDPGMESNQDGYFFTDGEMVSEFEDATKSIEPGEITMCKSDYGYHIIKRLPIDESDSKFGEYLENNKSAVQSAVTSKKQEEALEKKAEELGIKVEVNQDKIDKMVIQPKDTPEPTTEAK